MDYAIETLLKEYHLVRKCLSEWESKEYPRAKALRAKRLRELDRALIALGHDKHISQRAGASS
jgi:hypothetical protein